MTIRLQSLLITPRGPDGWTSGRLQFGRVATLLFGANGAGKTPVLRALEYALGHPVELPPQIHEHCRSIVLELRDGDTLYTVERILFKGLDVRVEGPGEKKWGFDSEGAFSEWLLPLLGPPAHAFTSKRSEASKPFMSVLGPLFLINQDTGWTQPYAPLEHHDFLKDQREEMVRWVMGLQPKNRPIDRDAFAAAKVEHESIQELVAIKRQTILSMARELGEDRNLNAIGWLQDRQTFLRQQLANLYSSANAVSQATAALDADIQSISVRRDSLQFRFANANRRLKQIAESMGELATELTALEDNEVAADAFRSFCGNENCQFFRQPEESYGRRVLYLRDQMKDFEFTSASLGAEVVDLQDELHATEATLREANQRKAATLSETDGTRVPSMIEALGRELEDASVRLDRIGRVEREKEQLHALLDKEEKARERVSELKPTGKGPRDKGALHDAKQQLTAAFREWVQVLRTKNLALNIEFDENLDLLLDQTPLTSNSHYSGSTRTRLILAYHAALVEASSKVGGYHPGFLILDAPKQHELSPEDFKNYVIRFCEMSSKLPSPIQIIFSTSDQALAEALADVKGIDEVWLPGFESQGERRYLGSHSGDLTT